MGFYETYTSTTESEGGKIVLTDDAFAVAEAVWKLIEVSVRK